MQFPDITSCLSSSDLPAEARGCAVTVYGSSSSEISGIYKQAASELGALVARAGRPLVSGGGREGLMGAAIDGALSEGGLTIGVLPAFMIEKGWNHPGLSQTLSVPDMHSRKAIMASMAGAAVAMPGGIGTFEELFEIVTWRQLGLWCGRVIILNTDGYYDPLLTMLDRAAEQHFMARPGGSRGELYAVASTPSEAMDLINDSAR